jgi:crossover junction endodeoxyribonuclease RusA
LLNDVPRGTQGASGRPVSFEPRTVLLTLPWPPSTNKIWRAVAGRIILAKLARTYKARLAAALPSGPVQPLLGRLVVWMTLHAPAKIGPVWDCANREKLLFDTLTQQRVWDDDSQIDCLMIVRGAPDPGRGYVELAIREVAP